MHSISTLTVSRERQKPASSIVKPTCMPNTRNAATSVHAVLTGLTMSLPLSCGSAAKAAEAHQIGTEQNGAQQQQGNADELAHEQQRSISPPLGVGQPLFQARYFTE